MFQRLLALIALLGLCFVCVGCEGDDLGDIEADDSEIIEPGDPEHSGRVPPTGSQRPAAGDDTP